MPIRRIPSLNWLRVFETAARSESFARAARLLNMSAPAVSQQIKALESHLEKPLFERGPRSVTLTRAGEAFLPVVEQALRSVETTAASLFGDPTGEPLSVQASLMFACAWLAPRLNDFAALHPKVQLQMMTANYPEDFRHRAADLQIDFGPDAVRAGEGDLLFGEVLTPVAPPALAAAIKAPADLFEHRLIEIATHRSGWHQILEAAPEADLARAKFSFADTTQLSLAMAAGGFGIALARAPATDALLDLYGLVPCLEDLRIEGSRAYYLLYPSERALTPAAGQFRSWLLEATAPYG